MEIRNFNITNNGKRIAHGKKYEKNLVKTLALVLSFTLVTGTAVGCSKTKEEEDTKEVSVSHDIITNPINPDSVLSSEGAEALYDEIEYEVKMNETLSGIVTSYITTDPNKMYDVIDEIERNNHLSHSVLNAGQTIKLYQVPEHNLEELGYTSDYEVQGDKYLIEDRYNYICKITDEIERKPQFYRDSENESVKNSYYRLMNFKRSLDVAYSEYTHEEYSSETDINLEFNILLAEERCVNALLDFGYDFELHKTARPRAMFKEEHIDAAYGL